MRNPAHEPPSAAAAPLAVPITKAAEMCGVSRRTFYDRVLPELATVRIGRRLVVPVKELEKWIDEHRQPPPPATPSGWR